MTDALTQVVVWLNAIANALGRWLLAPIAVLPGWLSATLVGMVTGVLLLLMFKYTSSQAAIKRVRNDINANLLTLKLFKESALVALGAQGRLLVGAFRLFVLALVPMAVMMTPVTLLLGQLSLWYQSRALQVGQEALVVVTLHAIDPMPEVQLQPTDALEIAIGPVRVPSKHAVYWNVKAKQDGRHDLTVTVDGQSYVKEVVVGDGMARVSKLRPGWSWSDALLNPAEQPFAADAIVQAIEFDYPARSSWTSGADWWVVYWFAISMLTALALRRALGVNV